MGARRAPGQIRDAIIACLQRRADRTATVEEIRATVAAKLGGGIPSSSIRSYLNINTPATFERVARGTYRLKP